MSTRFMLACSALAAIMLAATVTDPWSGHPVPVTVGSGQPPATSDCTQQNLLASLRPQGPLPAPGQMPAGSTMAQIAKRGYLTVNVLEDTPPVASRDVKDVNLRLEGFDVDIARDIAEAIFGNREGVVFQPLPVANRFEIVRSGQVDLTIAAATITCQRRELVDFSTVYYEAGQRVLVNRDSAVTSLDDLRDKRVCAATGSTPLETIQAASAKPIPVGVATDTDCLMLLQLGDVDAVSTDDILLAGMTTQDAQTKIVGPRFTAEPYGVAINKNSPDLVRFVNAVLQRRVEDGRWQTSYEHWLAPLGLPASLPTPQYRD
ncbi:MAG: glutamate ABC transporter substrate-binding protein [Pseudonocardiaceae bacterium]